jgi:Fe-S-cluster containining protein
VVTRKQPMSCRRGCGACCIAPSIRGPLPGMPRGKPAGVPCVNLDPRSQDCRIWGTEAYPALCARFQPETATCGDSRDQALALIARLEAETA